MCGTGHEVLKPLRQFLRQHFGTDEQHVAIGLMLRHDHGSQFMSHDFQAELRLPGIRSSPAFVAEPEYNGVAERFIRARLEQLLWVETFDTVEDLRLALNAFRRR